MKGSVVKRAKGSYLNPFFNEEEFRDDLRHLSKLLRCFRQPPSSFPVRLAFNHFMIACNCFGLLFVREYMEENIGVGKASWDEFLDVLNGRDPSTPFGVVVRERLCESLGCLGVQP